MRRKWKRQMRRGAVALIASAMAMSMTIGAWGAKKTEYSLTLHPSAGGEVQITAGAQIQPVLDSLGKAAEIKTLANCANGGKEKVYIYDNFDIYTTQNKKKVTVVDKVVLKNDKEATEEGVKIGQTPKDVKKAYPEAAENMGIYTVTLGNSQIVIDCGMKNDKVVDISFEYVEAK